jgi:hypothetical protein
VPFVSLPWGNTYYVDALPHSLAERGSVPAWSRIPVWSNCTNSTERPKSFVLSRCSKFLIIYLSILPSASVAALPGPASVKSPPACYLCPVEMCELSRLSRLSPV